MLRFLLVLAIFLLAAAPSAQAQSTDSTLALDQWHYIEVDSTRDRWGDYADPEWLRYFGLDTGDLDGDGDQDLLAGRHVYLNPGGDLTGTWEKIDLGLNVDGLLITDVDGDAQADVIAQALPDVYWLEADDESAQSWTPRKVGTVPATSHVNSQGFELADVFAGGRPEVLIAGNGDIYALEIPDAPADTTWPRTRLAANTSDEGIGTGDLDGDGDLDIAAGRRPKGEDEPTELLWWENPGTKKAAWQAHPVGETSHPIDRVAIADLDGTGWAEIVMTEERYPGPDPDANLFVFTHADTAQADTAQADAWQRRAVLTTYSLNNLDVADVDRDGDPDLVTSEHKGPDLRLLLLENDGAGQFTEHTLDQGKESHLGTQAADLDGDGDLDLASIGWDQEQYLHVWRNDAIAPAGSEPTSGVQITDTTLAGAPHFRIATERAVYWYDRAGGGFSRLIDRDGTDWIAFQREPWGEYPASAASAYRGLPNLVHGSDASGAGHPGFEQCTSRRAAADAITSECAGGTWRWTWTFAPEHATLQVEEVDPAHPYWFLYEGPPAGRFAPQQQYWGTNDGGPRRSTPDYFGGTPVLGAWQWAYIGDDEAPRVLFAAQHAPDEEPDLFAYLGSTDAGTAAPDGMVVLGFGRADEAAPQLTTPHAFTIGFVEEAVESESDHERVARAIEARLR